ncbi:MAG TPA: DUF1287 domain-containing protein [Terracidiphilus sp.]|jgi:hypothetical protein|nr:DUF1287 domain-containing protein [Terracidiphilus sp.]
MPLPFLSRRSVLASLVATAFTPVLATPGDRLAAAARAQVGVTTIYDPNYTRIAYPNGDVPRTRGVCADVIIRAGRDALGLDLQRLVHDDMAAHFEAYPSRRVWGERGPDSSIDHRRVLNLETFFTRAGCRLWAAARPTPGDAFPLPLAAGDIVTWLLDARLPHIGIVVAAAPVNARAHVAHNIGRGAEESALAEFSPHRAVAHYRWPKRSFS